MNRAVLLLVVLSGCGEYFGWDSQEGAKAGASYKEASADIDGDGIANATDLDADGDGIMNREENELGIEPQGDNDKDGVKNMFDATDRGDGKPQACAANEEPNLCSSMGTLFDADEDGVPNHHDSDADGDGIADNVESGIGGPCPGVVGLNGLCDAWETEPDSGVSVWPPADPDRDGLIASLDPLEEQKIALPQGRLLPGSGTRLNEPPWKALGVAPFINTAPALARADHTFVDATDESGFGLQHELEHSSIPDELRMLSGAAAEDIDGDGDIDVYLPRGEVVVPNVFVGSAEKSVIMRNIGNGIFKAETHDTGITQAGGALLFDRRGERLTDILVTSLDPTGTALFGNTQNGFVAQSVPVIDPSYSASAGDVDGDGLLDLFITHGAIKTDRPPAFLLRNLGPVSGWRDLSGEANLPRLEDSRAAIWADVDHDSWPDVLVTADAGGSMILLNRKDQWLPAPTAFTDENATGQALGDIDNDGDLDWFVSGVGVEKTSDLPKKYVGTNLGISGNRLMRNDGGGSFTDITDESNVRNGWWAWAACVADINLDGWQDIVQVSGWREGAFERSVMSVWLNGGPRGFMQQREPLGITVAEQGRGVVCADFDNDGDVDLLATNQGARPRLWRNVDANKRRNWLQVQLEGVGRNTKAIGAKIVVRSATLTQFREVQAGASYLSQAPSRQAFGLAGDVTAEVTVIWPNQERTVVASVAARQILTITQPGRRQAPYRPPVVMP